jgi:hypothetical protein
MPEAESTHRRIYFFDGSAGCDLCAASTGYTFGERPKRPHPFCDCPIEELVELRDDVAEEDIPEALVEHTELGDDGYEDPSAVTAGATIPIVPIIPPAWQQVRRTPSCHTEIRNVSWSVSHHAVVKLISVSTCRFQSTSQWGTQEPPSPQVLMSSELEQAAQRAGWAHPVPQYLRCMLTLKPKHTYEIEIDIERVVHEVMGECWEVCSNGTTRYLYPEWGTSSVNLAVKCSVIWADKC